MKFLDKTGLAYVWSKIQTLLATKADKTATTQSAAGLMSAADKTKLDDMATPAFGTCATAADEQNKVVSVSDSNW